ncbi:MAG: ABC transporter ATP-binding protein, partial [Syntrophothermus sp.]
NIREGQLIALTGKSGSGKSTLLNLMTGIDRPTNGDVIINNISLNSLSESGMARFRGVNIGIVFQFFQLLPTLTILENVMLPMDFCGTYPKKERKMRAMSLLKKAGIEDQSGKLPSALSGGQQQRAAIARALANDPDIIVADEPTGNLDSHNAELIFDLFRQLSESGKTIVVVTHEKEFARFFNDTIQMNDGEVIRTEGIVDLSKDKSRRAI